MSKNKVVWTREYVIGSGFSTLAGLIKELQSIEALFETEGYNTIPRLVVDPATGIPLDSVVVHKESAKDRPSRLVVRLTSRSFPLLPSMAAPVKVNE